MIMRGTIAVVAGAAAISAAIVVGSLAARGSDASGWLLAARYTARFSFVILLGAFIGPGWIRGVAGPVERAGIMAFGAAHGIHLAALTTYRIVAGTVPGTAAFVVGGAGYALLGALLIAIARGRVNRAFGSAALHYLLAVFLLTYARKIGTPDQHWVGVVGTAVCGAAFVLRHLPRKSLKSTAGSTAA